jgi:hypothetical protein
MMVELFTPNPRFRRGYTAIHNILRFILRHMGHILGLNNMPNSRLNRFLWVTNRMQLKCNIHISINSNSHIRER